jgi:nucleoside-diphosphate-sugar epimerase
LANAAIKAVETEDAIGEIYNIGAKEFGTMRQAYNDLINHADVGASVTGLPRHPTKFAMWLLDWADMSPLTTFHYKTIDKDFYFDISKAMNDLSWEPQDSNYDCMRRGYDWYISNKQSSNSGTKEGHRKAPEEGLLNILRKIS